MLTHGSIHLGVFLAGMMAVASVHGAAPKQKTLDCTLPNSLVGAWVGDQRAPTAFERIDFFRNRAFSIYMGGQVSTKGTWSIDDNCVITARTLSSPRPWVFRFERRAKPAMLLLREEGDARPAHYSLLNDPKH